MLIINAELAGSRGNVRLGETIQEVSTALTARPGEFVLDAKGGALLPGLHDHHMHFLAAAAYEESINCDDEEFKDVESFRDYVELQKGDGWIRAVNFSETVFGFLDARAIDELVDSRPIRMQHSSGKFWVLNSLGIEALKLRDFTHLDGVESDNRGNPTGRLFRMDDWLRNQAKFTLPDIKSYSQKLSSYGITSFTDTSATNNSQVQMQFKKWLKEGLIQQKYWLMGDETIQGGPMKIVLDEDALPDIKFLLNRINIARQMDRNVAFHCTTHVELLFALAALKDSSIEEGDRIEHGSIITDEMIKELRGLGLTVVTQPGFLWERGDRYLEQLSDGELRHLYRCQSLIDQGVNVAVSSDAPYGPISPWDVIKHSTERLTKSDVVVGEVERISASTALRSYLTSKGDPAGEVRQVQAGFAADLCLLDRPLSEALKTPYAVSVVATLVDGSPTHGLQVDGRGV